MLAELRSHISLKDLVKRTYAEIMRDDVMGLAAQLAFYLVLAVPPVLVCLIAVASLFPLQNFVDDVTRWVGPFVPADALEIIQGFMIRIGESRDTGLLSLGLVLAIWSASAPMVAVINVMNRAYGVRESRPWWKVRLTAILLSLGMALFIVTSFMLVVFGPQLAELLAYWFGWSQLFVMTWKTVQWPLIFALVTMGIGLVYYFAPDVEQEWVWITPGSILATLLWLAGSLGFRFYAVNFGNYEATYGAIGGMILLLMWFYLSGIAVLIGAELNAEIEHASPWGKDPGERKPGERLKVGALAERAWHLRRGRRPESTSGG
jgi:membrane protein